MLAIAKVFWKAAQYSTALSYVHSALVHASVSHYDTIAIEALVWASSCWEMLCPNLQQEANACTEVSYVLACMEPIWVSHVLVWKMLFLYGELSSTGAIASDDIISTAAAIITIIYIYDHHAL